MDHIGLSPWTDYTVHLAVTLAAVAILLAILFAGAFLVINFGLMSRRSRDQGHGGQEPSDVGFLQRERFKGAHSHREYLPAEEGPDEYWHPEEEQPIPDEKMLHEEEMPADVGRLFREHRARRKADHAKGA